MTLRGRLSPLFLSIVYCLLASVSVGLTSFFEGTLFTDLNISHNGNSFVQYAYINNHSTILNFLLLNPLAIYFLLKASNGYAKAYKYFRNERGSPTYHQFGKIVISAVIGTGMMYFYFKGFLEGSFFSAAFEPDTQGKAVLSNTGVLIFFWTALYLSFLCLSCFDYGRYIIFLRDRRLSDFGISISNRVHHSVVLAITPCLQIMYALTTIFVVLVIFIVRDMQFDIKESIRIWLLIPYLMVGICSAIPFFHLHKLMKSQKEELRDRSSKEVEKLLLGAGVSFNWKNIELEKVLSAAELTDKSNKLCDSIKTWPVQINALTMPNISFALSLVTLTYKISSIFFTTQTT